MSVGVVFENYGPYHRARVAAAGRVADVLCVELHAVSGSYGWEPPSKEQLRKVTLFAADERNLESGKLLYGRLDRALAAENIAVLLANGWGDAGAPAVINWAVSRNVPVVFMSESSAMDNRRRPWREFVKRRIIRLGAAALVGGSTHADYLVQLGMPRDRVFLGYDAVDNEHFAAGAAKARSEEQSARSQYGLPQRYLLASARFVEKKNLPRLLEGFALYRAQAGSGERGAGSKGQSAKGQAWDLVLLGDGPLRPALCSQLQALGLRQSVLLPGFKQYPDLSAYYGLANAFIHASTTEQWGLVVNEAMASGLPVLVSNRCGCAPDLVQDGVNGFTFDPYSVEAIANAMLRMWKMEDGRRKMMGAESARIISNWGPDRFAQGLKQAVDVALASPPPKATWVDRLLLRLLMLR